MICFSGLRSTLYRPGSRLSTLAAWSKRSIIASNGFSSARKVSFSGRMIAGEGGGAAPVFVAGSLIARSGDEDGRGPAPLPSDHPPGEGHLSGGGEPVRGDDGALRPRGQGAEPRPRPVQGAP